MLYDVLVVGAGPAGLTAGRRLADEGFRVGILEEHAEIGNPVNCSGIIGVEAFDRFDLPRRLSRHTLQQIEFVSPRGQRWSFEATGPLAEVVERFEFDRLLGDRAIQAGAEVLLSHRVVEVRSFRGRVDLDVRVEGHESRVLGARAVVVATGAGMPLLRKLGFGRVPERLLGVQAELAMSIERVEVFLGREWAPEGFAWIVPLGSRHAKVGLLCHRNGPQTLKRFLSRPDVAPRLEGPPESIRCSVLPIGFLPRSYGDRMLVVGEAAGHIKATTCGGIYYGMLTGEMAGDALAGGLRKDRLGAPFLKVYEDRWRDLLEAEIETGLKLRRSFKLINDWGVERLMDLARRDGLARLIREKADFDWHRELIRAVFRHATVGRILGAA
jgi:digeranylgeranylglycerophospholipid reductase